MKKYNSLEELLREVQATRVLDTSLDFITHVQDLIGHSTTEELEALAFEYKENFYRVYDEAQGIESTLRFFATFSNFAENARDVEADRDKYIALYNSQKSEMEKLKDENIQLKSELENVQRKAEELEERVDNQKETYEAEIKSLKSKLYDYITAQ